MEVKRVRKIPGCSLIEVDGVCFEFVAGDGSSLVVNDTLVAAKQIDAHLKLFRFDE